MENAVLSNSADRDFTMEDNILKGKDVPFRTEYTNIGKLLLDRMKAEPNFVGQIDVITEKMYTFGKMYEYTVKCALWLRRQGVQRNDVISLCCPNIMDSFAPLFASFCVGAIFTPWNPSIDLREARYFVKLSGAKIVFADESSVEMILEAARLESCDIKIVVVGESPNALSFSEILKDNDKSDANNFECTPVENVHETAAIIYSSGTTGLPKGVLISHLAFLSNVLLPCGFNAEGIAFWLSGYSWVSGILLTCSSIVNYCQRLLCPIYDEEMTCKIIAKYKVTWIFLTSSMVNRILKSGYLRKYDLSSVTKIKFGGTALNPESQIMLRRYFSSADHIQHYGMTELFVIVTTTTANHKIGSVGTVIDNAKIKIVDLETGNALGPNEKGEILAKTLGMTKGYYNNPRATKDTIDADGWLHSGDLGYYDEDGELFIVDRLKEIIKYRGNHVSPCEIESFMLKHPEVVDVAVVGVAHSEDDEHPMAFVSKNPDSKLTERELQEFVAKNMSERYHLRGGVKFVETLPYTASGKISRKDLKAMAKDMN